MESLDRIPAKSSAISLQNDPVTSISIKSGRNVNSQPRATEQLYSDAQLTQPLVKWLLNTSHALGLAQPSDGIYAGTPALTSEWITEQVESVSEILFACVSELQLMLPQLKDQLHHRRLNGIRNALVDTQLERWVKSLQPVLQAADTSDLERDAAAADAVEELRSRVEHLQSRIASLETEAANAREEYTRHYSRRGRATNITSTEALQHISVDHIVCALLQEVRNSQRKSATLQQQCDALQMQRKDAQQLFLGFIADQSAYFEQPRSPQGGRFLSVQSKIANNNKNNTNNGSNNNSSSSNRTERAAASGESGRINISEIVQDLTEYIRELQSCEFDALQHSVRLQSQIEAAVAECRQCSTPEQQQQQQTTEDAASELLLLVRRLCSDYVDAQDMVQVYRADVQHAQNAYNAFCDQQNQQQNQDGARLTSSNLSSVLRHLIECVEKERQQRVAADAQRKQLADEVRRAKAVYSQFLQQRLVQYGSYELPGLSQLNSGSRNPALAQQAALRADVSHVVAWLSDELSEIEAANLELQQRLASMFEASTQRSLSIEAAADQRSKLLIADCTASDQQQQQQQQPVEVYRLLDGEDSDHASFLARVSQAQRSSLHFRRGEELSDSKRSFVRPQQSGAGFKPPPSTSRNHSFTTAVAEDRRQSQQFSSDSISSNRKYHPVGEGAGATSRWRYPVARQQERTPTGGTEIDNSFISNISECSDFRSSPRTGIRAIAGSRSSSASVHDVVVNVSGIPADSTMASHASEWEQLLDQLSAKLRHTERAIERTAKKT